jgi:hypothetical protein
MLQSRFCKCWNPVLAAVPRVAKNPVKFGQVQTLILKHLCNYQRSGQKVMISATLTTVKKPLVTPATPNRTFHSNNFNMALHN